jgi:glycosyltransferase involved in cell wall biosynthesis
VTRVHRYELYDEAFSPPFQPWTSVYDSLTCTVPIAQDGLDYLRRRGVDPSRLHLARLGVQAARTRAAPSADGVVRVVSCGNLVPVKRVPLCAQALIALAERHPRRRFAWTLFGDGPERDAVQAVLQRAPPNLVVTLGGSTPNEEVLSHYAAQPVDLFILLSASEGLPVALQEALAAGVPVLATDVGGVREAVDPGGENGALLPVDASLESIFYALEVLLIDVETLQSAARRDAAWRRWALDFDAERNHSALARMLAEIPEG